MALAWFQLPSASAEGLKKALLIGFSQIKKGLAKAIEMHMHLHPSVKTDGN